MNKTFDILYEYLKKIEYINSLRVPIHFNNRIASFELV